MANTPWEAWQTWVAITALVQPWLGAGWRRFFRQGAIDIHETGNIETGYSMFGPIVVLQGTLRSIHRDMFVRRMSMEVVRESDGARHRFEWLAVGPSRVLLFRPDENFTAEQPAGFMLLTVQPHRYNVIFYDRELWLRMQPHLQRLTEAWFQANSQETSFEDFSRTQLATDVWVEIDRACYWEEGSYLVTLMVETTRPDRQVDSEWHFTLTAQDASHLRLNSVGILAAACGQPNHHIAAFSAYRP